MTSLTLAIIGYFFIHSLLATEGVKRFFTKIFPSKFYRLFFNFVAIAGLLPIVYFFLKTERELLFDSMILKIIGLGLAVLGLVLLKKAMKNYDLGEFVGTSQLKTNREKIIGNLNTSGMNSKVRHPLYFASLLLIWGTFLAIPANTVLVIAVVSTLYIFVGTVLEEQKLVNDFGEAYRRYQKEVPMLLPRFFQKRIEK